MKDIKEKFLTLLEYILMSPVIAIFYLVCVLDVISFQCRLLYFKLFKIKYYINQGKFTKEIWRIK